MSMIEVVSAICKLVTVIVDTARSVARCKGACLDISERCQSLIGPVNLLALDNVKLVSKERTLHRMLNLLQVILAKCELYLDKSYFFKFLIAIRGKNPAFESLNGCLTELRGDLGFEVVVCHAIDAAEERRRHAEERQVLNRRLAQFIQVKELKITAAMSVAEKEQLIGEAAERSFALAEAAEQAAMDSSDSSAGGSVDLSSSLTPTDGRSLDNMDTLESFNAIDLSKLVWSPERSTKLGQGGFATVYEVTHGDTRYALKVLSFQGTPTAKELKKARREARSMYLCQQTNIIRFYSVDFRKGYILLELAAGSMHDVIHRGLMLPGDAGTLSTFDAQQRTAIDIFKGLQFMHYHGIIHRDIKSHNILMVVSDSTGQCVAKIADFGLATSDTFSVSATRTKEHAVGTDAYMAPELLDFDGKPPYSFASDIYAAGISLNELGTRASPWEGLKSTQMAMKVLRGIRPPLITPRDDMELEYVTHVGTCLHQDPAMRSDTSTLLAELNRHCMPASQEEVVSDSLDSLMDDISELSVQNALIRTIRNGSLSSVHEMAAAVAELWALVEDVSTDEANKTGKQIVHLIMQAEGIPSLVRLLEHGTPAAREHCAGVLRRVSYHDNIDCNNRKGIVMAGGIPLLIELLRSGTPGGKEQASAALKNLSIKNDPVRRAIVAAGGIPMLIELLRSGSPGCKEQAAGVITSLAFNDDDVKKAIVAAGEIPVLIELLRSGTPGGKEQAVGALRNLATDDDVKKAIVTADGIPLLIELLRSGSPGGKEQAVGALRNLATDDDVKKAIVTAGVIPLLIELLRTGSPGGKEQAAGALRNLATDDDDIKKAIVTADGIPLLIELLRSGTPGGKEQAAGALLRTVANDDIGKVIAAAGGVPLLIELLRTGSPDGKEQAVGFLMNLIASNDDKKAIVAAGCIPLLIYCLSGGTPHGKEHAAGALSNLARNDNDIRKAVAAADGIPPLIVLLRSGTPCGKELAAGALRNLAPNDDIRNAIGAAGGIFSLIDLLRSGTPVGKEEAAGALRNLASNDERRRCIAKAGGIPILVELLHSGTPGGKEYAAGALRNLASVNSVKKAIIAAGAIHLLVKLMYSGTPGGKEHAVGALRNLCFDDKQVILTIAAAGGIPPLIELLRSGTPGCKEQADGALRNLAANDDIKKSIAASLQWEEFSS